jgi:hypothetical protein
MLKSIYSLVCSRWVDERDITFTYKIGAVNENDHVNWKDMFSQPGLTFSGCCKPHTRCGCLWFTGIIRVVFFIVALVFFILDVVNHKDTFMMLWFHPNRLIYVEIFIYMVLSMTVPRLVLDNTERTDTIPILLEVAWLCAVWSLPASIVALWTFGLYGHDGNLLVSYIFNLIWIVLDFAFGRIIIPPNRIIPFIIHWVCWGVFFVVLLQQGAIEGLLFMSGSSALPSECKNKKLTINRLHQPHRRFVWSSRKAIALLVANILITKAI